MQERDDRLIGRIASILRRSGDAEAAKRIDSYAARFGWDAPGKQKILKQAQQRAARERERQKVC